MKMPVSLRRLLYTLALLALAAAVLPEPYGAQATGFAGRVTHLVTGEPIAGAVVAVGEHVTQADDQGWYILILPPGRYDVDAQAPGYIGMSHTLRSVTTGLAQLDFAMIPREPDAEMSRQIDEKLEQYEQEISVELEAHILHDGQVVASGMTSVPRTVRLLVRENPAVIDSPPVEVIVLDFEEYLKGVVPVEMSPAWPQEALKAQAVAARSYAAASMGKHAAEGADVCSSVHCQAWRPTHYETTDRAVEATRGVAATYGGSIIWAFFHSCCGGHTQDIEDVWPSAQPLAYARGVPCPCQCAKNGHGIGMCQYGARAMAQAGATYDQILKHYYTGIDLLIPQRGVLSEGRVEPVAGDQGTRFVYRVRYRDDLGAPPPIANVIINERAETMRREGGDAAAGWTYVYTGTLPAGEHSFRFLFDDGHGHIAQAPATGAYGGPSVSASGAPSETLRANLTFATAADWATGQPDGLAIAAETTTRLILAQGRQEGLYTSAALTPGATFVGYGVFWQADAPGTSAVTIEARSSMDGAVWGAWRALEGEAYVAGADSLWSSPLILGEARYVQFRARLKAGLSGEQPSLRHLRIACIDSRQGPSSDQWEAPSPAAAAGAPVVITRAQWGANEAWMTWPPEYRDVRALVLHHTVLGDASLDPAAVVRAIYYYHAIEREWGDIGYNYLVDSYGRVYEGRAGGPGVVGAHARIYNYGSAGIGMIGDFQENPVPPNLYNGLTDLTAYLCTLHGIDPLAQTLLIDAVLPTILAHRDVAATLCPGQYFYPLMGAVRADTLAKMAPPPPTVAFTWPAAGALVRGVATPQVTSDGIVTHMAYYVDGVLQASAEHAFAWKWNTTLAGDGPHQLRVLAENPGGSAEASVAVQVDNTPPTGGVAAPAWTNAVGVTITITSTDAVSMALSSGWSWEGESLYHQTGVLAADPAASGGRAWLGRGGVDPSGPWYGPYTCALPAGRGYQVVFTLKTDQYTSSAGLATLDVADGVQGLTYALRPMAGDDLTSGAYQEFVLPLDYAQAAPSCGLAQPNKGLEFRTWFSGAGNLWLDRVQVFTAPEPLAATLWWDLPSAEGSAKATVRLLDAAGNAANHEITVGVDRTPPAWVLADGSGYWVRDRLAGLDVGRAAWSHSSDGGQTWGDWQPLTVAGAMGVHSAVLLYADAPTDGHVRYLAMDLAGNETVSPALPAGNIPTSSGPDRLTFMPMARH